MWAVADRPKLACPENHCPGTAFPLVIKLRQMGIDTTYLRELGKGWLREKSCPNDQKKEFSH